MVREFSDKLDLSFKQIKNWFELNRKKYRNHMKLAFKTSNFKNLQSYVFVINFYTFYQKKIAKKEPTLDLSQIR